MTFRRFAASLLSAVLLVQPLLANAVSYDFKSAVPKLRVTGSETPGGETPAPSYSLSAAALDFGTVAQGSTLTRGLSLTNTGAVALSPAVSSELPFVAEPETLNSYTFNDGNVCYGAQAVLIDHDAFVLADSDTSCASMTDGFAVFRMESDAGSTLTIESVVLSEGTYVDVTCENGNACWVQLELLDVGATVTLTVNYRVNGGALQSITRTVPVYMSHMAA